MGFGISDFPLGGFDFLSFRFAIIHGPKRGVSFSSSGSVAVSVAGVGYAGLVGAGVTMAGLGVAAFFAATANRQDSIV